MEPHKVNEGVHWEDTGPLPIPGRGGGPEHQQEPELVPALQATRTGVLFFFLSGLEPNIPGHPGGQDRTPRSKSHILPVKWAHLVGAGGQFSEKGVWALRHSK